MTPRTKYLHFWYEVSTTSADPNGSKWQGQLRLGKDLADGRQAGAYFGRPPGAGLLRY